VNFCSYKIKFVQLKRRFCKLPSGVWGRAPAEIEFDALYP